MISIEIFDSLEAVEADWLKLASAGAARHVFFTPEWARAWFETAGGGELRLHKVRNDGRLIGLVPLLRKDGVTTLLGDKEVCDYLDVLALPGEETKVVEALLEDFEAGGEVLDLVPLRPDSVLFQLLPALAEKRGVCCATEMIDVSFDVPLPSSWEEYLKALRGKDRHELRRKLRNLSKSGETSFYNVPPTSENMRDFFHLFRISREDKEAFMTPGREAFFTRLAHDLGEMGWVQLSFLELDEQRVATAMCFDYGDAISLYNSGYEPEFGPLSVGLLCKAMTIRQAIEKGRKVYDFLRGAEDYKFHLGGKPFSIYRMVLTQGTK